ncbi:MAG: c-type cytochrome [Planctomycetota bacterium]
MARLALLAVLLILLPSGARSTAVVPQDIFANPENLTVLPKDITPRELNRVMREASIGLGVRCWACHVGEEGRDLSTFDFVSDEKPMKEAARVMLRMVMDINEKHLPKLEELKKGKDDETEKPKGAAALIQKKEPATPRVRCATCHQGKVKVE